MGLSVVVKGFQVSGPTFQRFWNFGRHKLFAIIICAPLVDRLLGVLFFLLALLPILFSLRGSSSGGSVALEKRNRTHSRGLKGMGLRV